MFRETDGPAEFCFKCPLRNLAKSPWEFGFQQQASVVSIPLHRGLEAGQTAEALVGPRERGAW